MNDLYENFVTGGVKNSFLMWTSFVNYPYKKVLNFFFNQTLCSHHGKIYLLSNFPKSSLKRKPLKQTLQLLVNPKYSVMKAGKNFRLLFSCEH